MRRLGLKSLRLIIREKNLNVNSGRLVLLTIFLSVKKMRSRFALTNSPRLKKASAVQPKKPKKKLPVKKQQPPPPVVREFEPPAPAPEPSTTSVKEVTITTSRPASSIKTVSNQTTKIEKPSRDSLVAEYQRLASEYQHALENRENLQQENQNLQKQINAAYKEQAKLEKDCVNKKKKNVSP